VTDRPRPQYGEYASPEEQSQASGTPVEPAIVVPPATAAPLPPLVEYTPPRTWDRVLTAILIAIGAYTVLNYFATLTNLGSVLAQAFTTAGYGEFQSQALANQLGVVATVIIVVLYASSTTLALLSLRAGRVSFWIPVTAGALAFLTVLVVMMVIVFADPGFQAYVESISTQ